MLHISLRCTTKMLRTTTHFATMALLRPKQCLLTPIVTLSIRLLSNETKKSNVEAKKERDIVNEKTKQRPPANKKHKDVHMQLVSINNAPPLATKDDILQLFDLYRYEEENKKEGDDALETNTNQRKAVLEIQRGMGH